MNRGAWAFHFMMISWELAYLTFRNIVRSLHVWKKDTVLFCFDSWKSKVFAFCGILQVLYQTVFC